MKKRDYRLFFNDILECANQIIKFTEKLSYEDFIADEMVIKAVERNFEIMGEAVKYIPDDVRERFNSISFRKIAGLRNILIHNYLGIDYEIMWEIIKNSLPELITQTEIALTELNKEME